MLERSSSSVKIYSLDPDAVRSALLAAGREILARCPQVLSIRLFGSFSRGQAVPGSDVDLVVLLAGPDDRPWPQRMGEFLPFFVGLGMPVELFCYTEQEWQAGLQAKNLLFQEMARGELVASRTAV